MQVRGKMHHMRWVRRTGCCFASRTYELLEAVCRLGCEASAWPSAVWGTQSNLWLGPFERIWCLQGFRLIVWDLHTAVSDESGSTWTFTTRRWPATVKSNIRFSAGRNFVGLSTKQHLDDTLFCLCSRPSCSHQHSCHESEAGRPNKTPRKEWKDSSESCLTHNNHKIQRRASIALSFVRTYWKAEPILLPFSGIPGSGQTSPARPLWLTAKNEEYK